MPVKGGYLAIAGAGGLFLWSAVKGKSVTSAFRALVGGQSPATASSANAVTSPDGSGGGGAAGSGPVSNPSQYQAYAFSLFPGYGWGADQQQPLVQLWTRESNWDPTAYNPGSHTTNPDESHAFGIPQALPASKMASAGADWRTNGQTQIRWGLSYIAQVYHNPAGAWAHEVSAGWY
jgi:hypothetical protein